MKNTTFALLIVAAAALSACGGGGGGGDSAGSPNTPTTPEVPVVPTVPNVPTTPEVPVIPVPPVVAPAPTIPVASVPPVARVPTPTYTAGSASASAFDVVNAERSKCGFGKVAQNAQLDAAAAAHGDYLKARFNAGVRNAGHTEDPALTGFTGVTPTDRAVAAGYAAGAGEYLSYYGYGITNDHGNALVRTMFASIYHLAGMLDGNRDVGVAVSFAEQGNPATAILTWMNGTPAGVAKQESTDVLTYPCDGSTGVQPYMFGENPDPFAGLGFPADDNVGQPIYVRAPAGQAVQLLSATLTSSAGHSVPVFLYHASQDPQKALASHQAFVVPREALAQETTYTVQVQGTANGIGFARTFSFTTLKF